MSVIIPVYNDAERLKLCLEALENQTYPKTGYEVIVVDNASDEAADIKGVVAQFGQAIAAYESTPGSYAARNKGISLAKGEVIAFTDADCIPASDWIEKGVENLLKVSNCGLLAGNIEVFPKDINRPTLVELFEIANAFPQKQHLRDMKYGATANLLTFKSVIQEVGTFNQDLKSGGDLDWGRRVYDHGYEQVYAEEVRIAHPARASFNQIYQKVVRLAGGHYDLLNRNLYHFFHPGTLLFAISNQNMLPAKLLKNLMFWAIFCQDLIPPVMYITSTFKNPK
ncbi:MULTISPECIES: glycosyltransferase [unclassified Coleofasciculus]|uniref:glycosyltransferase n=1 Tax=unclassified Coleofasciculus TaxID=2692782 RepID=UPI002AD2B7F1|nr:MULTISPECIES: glycosyltransferase [unclassified Coleofasciculus]